MHRSSPLPWWTAGIVALDRLSITRRRISYRMEMVRPRAVAETAPMTTSPITRRFALLPADGGFRIYADSKAERMSDANASTSSGVVSHEHIQRTSPVVSSHV